MPGESGPITEEQIMKALQTVIDPELGVNIVDLGLVYAAGPLPNGDIHIQMTMTTPVCPLSEYLLSEAESAVRRAFPDAGVVQADLVWNPPWDPIMMSDAARTQMGWGE